MQLRCVNVPILRCVAICPTCSLPSDELPLAENGIGGNYRTWVHTETGVIYRQDLETVHYDATRAERELQLMRAHAGGAEKLLESPGTPLCKFCGTRFTPARVDVISEVRIDVLVVDSGLTA